MIAVTRQLHSGWLLGLAEGTNNLGLTMTCNVAVARKRREDILMSEILGPGFVLLGDWQI
jgi:hypothetical protein